MKSLVGAKNQRNVGETIFLIANGSRATVKHIERTIFQDFAGSAVRARSHWFYLEMITGHRDCFDVVKIWKEESGSFSADGGDCCVAREDLIVESIQTVARLSNVLSVISCKLNVI